ncbi:hypothetical protein [Marinobacterium lutimaris]|uniref:Uncharacterized protein n=1 Tax=Marinobacterium lutimaris TaxID=568106 RepID=A0A1H5U2M5_9GAMM|nr:hypothetical protein [Marinobacterium lutimaris]SEF68668.1 hypothetical protein SAMN05444390_101230 [Marinobacterium lutimaris]
MLTVKLIFADKKEELCRFSELPKAGQPMRIDELTYQVISVDRALSNTDPDGPDAIVKLSAGTTESPDQQIPVVQPGRRNPG